MIFLREIASHEITKAVKELFITSGRKIGDDVLDKITTQLAVEPSPVGKNVLQQLLDSYEISAKENMPICQDTGMAVLFVEIGQDVHIVDGYLEDAINQGVREAYQDAYFRKSIVAEPLFERVNTKDNTPAMIHTRIVPGDKIHILTTAKGFGSENMSALRMLVPADGVEGVKRFVLETVEKAGPNPCPPIIVGIGIGGSFEVAALLAKKCTARPLYEKNPHPLYAALEEELLEKINRLGIGPGGLGGKTTALKVSIDYAATHIAGLPVAINICCHAARHASITL